MSRSIRTTAIAVAGAVALASAAYALGSQRDDGSAAARNGADARGAAFSPWRWRGLDSLADRLGVSRAKLRDALAAVRDERRGRDDRLADLAKDLGVSTDKVEAAFAQLRDDHRGIRGPCDGDHGDLAADLAKALGISESKVQAALDAQRDRIEADRDAARRRFAEALAKQLDLSVDKVEDALGSLPHHWGPGPHRP